MVEAQDPAQEALAAEQEEELKGQSLEDDMAGAEEEEEEDEQEDENFINNHDLIGVKGIIDAQKNEIEKKKVRNWIDNCSRVTD